MTLKVTFSEMDLGTIWFMPKVKLGKLDLPQGDQNKDNLVAYIEVNSHSLSVMKLKMHSVARGSFLSVLKLHTFSESKTGTSQGQSQTTATQQLP